MQSCHVFVMSLKSSSKTSDNSEVQKGKIPYDSFREQGKIYYAQVVAYHYMNLFFPVKRNFAKKDNCGLPCLLHKHEGEVWHVAPEKWAWPGVDIFFFFARCEEFSIFFSTLVFGVLHVWHEGELGNLVRQINERHMCVELFFFHARNHSLSSLFSSTK